LFTSASWKHACPLSSGAIAEYDLWRDFLKTAPAFEARFKTEEDCRRYWIKARWGGKPACAKCS
jgi:hypothetical protein